MVSEKVIVKGGELENELDEGWWASVLADEVGFVDVEKDHPIRQGHQPNGVKEAWEQIKALFENDEVITMQVHGFNRGGLLVQALGVQGFVPISHLVGISPNLSEDMRHQALGKYINQAIQLKVIECEPAQERIVLSERAAQAGEGMRKHLFKSLKTGEIISGTVTNITDFGVFVDLGGIEGLIHVSELSWGRVQHPMEVLRVGETVKTIILHVNEENSRVALSLKRLQPNPWEVLVNRYKPGDVVNAKVSSIMRFGAFAHLEEGVEGLIHISSVAFPPGVKDLGNVLKTGQQVQVKILHIDMDRRRLGLGLVAVE